MADVKADVKAAVKPDVTEAKLDSERQSIRGRVCPRCGGKIIPADSAVYQSPGDPSAVFPSWQCERCGYQEVYEPKKTEKPKHTKE